jgi:hypothetical protein
MSRNANHDDGETHSKVRRNTNASGNPDDRREQVRKSKVSTLCMSSLPGADRAARDILNADRAAISEAPVCPKAAQESRLDSDREALAGIALLAFESAQIRTGRGRFDLGQPHGVAAFGAREDSDFSTAIEWILMGGWHDARLRSGGSAILSVTGNCRQGMVIGPACSPISGAAGQYCSLFQIVCGRTAPTRGMTN